MYYRSPSLNVPSNISWRLKATEFRPNPPIRKENKGFMARLKKLLGFDDLIEDYYDKQDELLQLYYEVDDINANGGYIPTSSQEQRLATKRGETCAINLSNYANLVLLISKMYASITSMSLAIIASTMDSLLDLLSGAILWWAAYSMKNLNKYLYPIGKKRRQPLGIMIFACVMAMLGLEIIVESCRKLNSKDHSSDLGTGTKRAWVIGIMVGVTVVKFLLMVFCRQYPDNEIVKAYAQDHFFDVVTNSIGLAAALLGQAYIWWIDPFGAILLALYTIKTWTKTLLESAQSLSSTSAPPEFLAKLTYLVWNHDRAIMKIDTIRAYTLGEQYFAEIDIILPKDMLLWKAHDIGESLQNKLETLPEIERAFVHLDYDDQHVLEHLGHEDY
ncbi:hypothetical protein M758_3G099800 [Ceratodon purpureus]|uniref:Cation efflux protein transmembrane domain-containing protein n=2 Tax=Ceratodon purpureus TaxID=3225 RepID=A0A8T0IKH7_CERPU|nr:hypothetical protein KC19_3G096700 [Ceratodon purpureus]KAG0622470.1 hypothetical protein M758_3G099800 [Ceratodon purpureus]